MMDNILRSGDADFLAMARPFVREPNLVNKIRQGRRGPVDCVSCNLCFLHEEIDPLQCWRTPSAILAHINKYYLKGVKSERRSRWARVGTGKTGR